MDKIKWAMVRLNEISDELHKQMVQIELVTNELDKLVESPLQKYCGISGSRIDSWKSDKRYEHDPKEYPTRDSVSDEQ